MQYVIFIGFQYLGKTQCELTCPKQSLCLVSVQDFQLMQQQQQQYLCLIVYARLLRATQFIFTRTNPNASFGRYFLTGTPPSHNNLISNQLLEDTRFLRRLYEKSIRKLRDVPNEIIISQQYAQQCCPSSQLFHTMGVVINTYQVDITLLREIEITTRQLRLDWVCQGAILYNIIINNCSIYMILEMLFVQVGIFMLSFTVSQNLVKYFGLLDEVW
eukprot:TRINITY_DN17829_c0_g1_i2.p1 TRINITY_DN17829_c0_g1~~TRINITY_DN17829_c0_g1_i2.p1  ORF type:complete len:216 (+),score=-4.16 TRINITY_DN17829_c0_g1_i2:150-797(+)